jgi:hypothetical protein
LFGEEDENSVEKRREIDVTTKHTNEGGFLNSPEQ